MSQLPDKPLVVEYDSAPPAPRGRTLANMAAACAIMPLPLILLVGLNSPFTRFALPMVVALPVAALALAIAAEFANRTGDKASRHRSRLAAFLAALVLSVEMALVLSAVGSGGRRPQAMRVVCASHMRQIGLALLMYANEHNNQLPQSLDPLLTLEDLSPEILLCPSSTDQKGQVSYVYVGAGKTNAETSNTVLLYEKPGHHQDGGMNVLYGDGHVEWVEQKEAKRVIAELQSGHNPPRAAPGPGR